MILDYQVVNDGKSLNDITHELYEQKRIFDNLSTTDKNVDEIVELRIKEIEKEIQELNKKYSPNY